MTCFSVAFDHFFYFRYIHVQFAVLQCQIMIKYIYFLINNNFQNLLINLLKKSLQYVMLYLYINFIIYLKKKKLYLINDLSWEINAEFQGIYSERDNYSYVLLSYIVLKRNNEYKNRTYVKPYPLWNPCGNIQNRERKKM